MKRFNCECDDPQCDVVIQGWEDADLRRDDFPDPDSVYVVALEHDEGNLVLYDSEDGWLLVRNRRP